MGYISCGHLITLTCKLWLCMYRYTHTTALYYWLIAVRPVYATYTVVSKERNTSSDGTEESFVFDSWRTSYWNIFCSLLFPPLCCKSDLVSTVMYSFCCPFVRFCNTLKSKAMCAFECHTYGCWVWCAHPYSWPWAFKCLSWAYLESVSVPCTVRMPGCQLRRDTRAMETDGVLRSLLGSPHHNHATMTTTAVVELPTTGHPRLSILDTCHRKIRLLGGGPVAFFGGLVAWVPSVTMWKYRNTVVPGLRWWCCNVLD